MALTVTARGSGTNNAGANPLNVSPSGNFAAGSAGVLAVTADNASSGGATNDLAATLTDSLGNTWTKQTAPIYDNGAASAGIQGAIYTSDCAAGAPQTSTTIPISSGVAATAKGWSLYEVVPAAGKRAVFRTGAVTTGATAANPSVTTVSVTVGEALFMAYHAENVNAVTGDSDTTNGTWGTLVSVTIGSTTSGIRHATQHKVQTTANSTQTWDITVASQDKIESYIIMTEVTDITASGGVSFGAPSLAATGAETFAASGGVTIAHATLAATGAEAFIASGGVAFGAPSLAAAGGETFLASGGVAFGPASIAGTGDAATGFFLSGGVAFGAPVLAGTGVLAFAASGGLSFGAPSLAGIVVEGFVATGGVAFAAPSLAATGAVIAQPTTGTAAVAFGPVRIEGALWMDTQDAINATRRRLRWMYFRIPG